MRKLIAAILIASTVFFHACTGKDALSDEESEPPDAMPAELPVPTLDKEEVVGARQAVKDVFDAEEQRIQDEAEKYRTIHERRVAIEKAREVRLEKERIALEQAEAEESERQRRLALEAERAKAEAAAIDEKEPTQSPLPSRGNSEQVGAGQAFTATFYTAFCPTGCTGVTATGLDVSNTIYTSDGLRIVAVDPSQIPLGSIVQVSLADGTVFNARAEDTGGAIKGRIIDVLVADRDEAYRLGRQSVRVHIIREGR